MIATAMLCLVLGLRFDPIDIPGFYVEAAAYADAAQGAGYRQADLDADGQLDLLLPARVLLQHDGAFDEAAALVYPRHTEQPFCDLWNGTIYLFLESRVIRLTVAGRAWALETEAAVAWPESFVEEGFRGFSGARNGTQVRFRRMLHDLDGDGQPEIVVPAPEGLAVYALHEGAFVRRSTLDVFPPMRLRRVTGRALWPETGRTVAFPARSMTCRFGLEGNRVTVLAREDVGLTNARYRTTEYRVTANTLQLEGTVVREELSAVVASSLDLSRLNADEALDFVGTELTYSKGTAVPRPLFTVRISTDNGHTFQEFRTTSFRPETSFVDFEGDGDLDLVLHRTGLFDGGPREVLSRAATARRLVHRVEVYVQSEGAFAPEPSVTGRFVLTLDAPPLDMSAMFRRYQTCELISAAGDFDGDGLKDIAAYYAPGRLGIYRCTGEAFSDSPEFTLPVAGAIPFQILDVNGDGRSDLVAPQEAPVPETESGSRVFFAREGDS